MEKQEAFTQALLRAIDAAGAGEQEARDAVGDGVGYGHTAEKARAVVVVDVRVRRQGRCRDLGGEGRALGRARAVRRPRHAPGQGGGRPGPRARLHARPGAS